MKAFAISADHGTYVDQLLKCEIGQFHSVYFNTVEDSCPVTVDLRYYFPAMGMRETCGSRAGFPFQCTGVGDGFMATTGAFASYDGWNNLNMVAGEMKDLLVGISPGACYWVFLCALSCTS
jgi:hypothetical protein